MDRFTDLVSELENIPAFKKCPSCGSLSITIFKEEIFEGGYKATMFYSGFLECKNCKSIFLKSDDWKDEKDGTSRITKK